MPRLEGLQILRALAALMVLVGHVLAEAEHYFGVTLAGSDLPWTRGVDIFFVISGFIITLSADRFAGRPGAFLWRRFLRVAPLYYLFTTLMVAVLLLAPGAAKDTALETGQILSSYLFLPYERYDGRIAPVLSLGWTLNYEIFFYALMAAALVLPRRYLAVSSAILALSAAGLMAQGGPAAVVFWTNPILIEFLFGIALARLWQAGLVRPSRLWAGCALIAGLCLLVVLHDSGLPRFLAAGVPAALIVTAGTLLAPEMRYPGQIWGDSSYALYLSHRFVLRAMTLVLVPLLPQTEWAPWIYVAATSVLAMIVGLCVYLWIERPFLASLARPAAPRSVPA